MAPSAINSESAIRNDQEMKETPSLNGKLSNMHLNGHLTNGQTNGYGNGHITLPNSSSDELYDLLCIGFGPASLAIAIALHDLNKSTPKPKAIFLEKQESFAWHAGMQLPGAHMQISFLKDLATPRNPRSQFTFINYLFTKGRLNQFINLSTFLPTRLEYEDYLRWCASHFEIEGNVRYGMEVERVRAGSKDETGKVTSWEVTARDHSGQTISRRAKHVVVAVGGRPVIPENLRGLKNVAHSSQFASAIDKIQKKEAERKFKFAVIGSGQSAAEIFNDLWSRFPDSEIRLIIKGASLRPSDDSPFVNEIFDPDRVDGIYNQDPSERAAALALDRGTNYGVVRLSLLEHLYEKLYMQRVRNPDSSQHSARIIPNRAVLSATQTDSKVLLRLGEPDEKKRNENEVDEWEADYVFVATGYVRNAHESLLSEVKDLLPEHNQKECKFPVGRDYRVLYDEKKVDSSTGVWLQGCNEGTHGLSDTLLSILAVRGGELVESMFGDDIARV